jgi:hypothetical protein
LELKIESEEWRMLTQRKIAETRQRLKGEGQKYKSKGKNGWLGIETRWGLRATKFGWRDREKLLDWAEFSQVFLRVQVRPWAELMTTVVDYYVRP